MNRLEDKELVKCCVEELSEKMGYADAGALSQRDYEHLCGVIEEKTGILISLSTIKRIFAGKFERLPQTATLNALTVLLGYGNWQDFKTRKRLERSHRPPLVSPSQPVAEPLPVGAAQFVAEPQPPNAVALPARPGRVAPFLKATALLLLVSLGVLGFFRATRLQEKSVAQDGGVVTFSARKAVASGVPNSVVFHYNVDPVVADSFFIQQSWDPSRRVPVSKNTYTQTDIYYEPGYYRAKLMADGKVLKEIPVSISTDGWMAYSRPAAGKVPQYVKGPVVHDGVLGINPADLPANAVASPEDRYSFLAFFPPALKGSGDGFTLKARLRMRALRPTQCPGFMVSVHCADGMHFFKNTISGCISEVDAMFSDTYVSGKKQDLSGMGTDVFNWHAVELRVYGKRARVLLDGKLVLETPYTRPAGPIKGITFVSTGLCEADEVTLLDAAGQATYHDHFNAAPPATSPAPGA